MYKFLHYFNDWKWRQFQSFTFLSQKSVYISGMWLIDILVGLAATDWPIEMSSDQATRLKLLLRMNALNDLKAVFMFFYSWQLRKKMVPLWYH